MIIHEMSECPECGFSHSPADLCHQCGNCNVSGTAPCCGCDEPSGDDVVKCNECRRAVMVKETCPHGFCPDCECNGCAEAEANGCQSDGAFTI